MKKKIILIVSWILCVGLAVSFIMPGYSKISPNEAMVRRFVNWGYSGGFATLIGILELSGGLLVLVPRLSFFGASILAIVMTGAVYTHLATGIGSPSFALFYLVIALIVAYLRYPTAYGLNKNVGLI